MEPVIAVTARCEARSVIRFLNAKNLKSIEIHKQLEEVYGLHQHPTRPQMLQRFLRRTHKRPRRAKERDAIGVRRSRGED
ncbi:uncharacterized protein LOC143206576 [Rhynchophorus ferrugineus]|uniref:uncharacterized protein LOC143206576 n=1 Tax=Rhynchophorus ferrugineus TaxID=354439 RepID=UPI003FCD0469